MNNHEHHSLIASLLLRIGAVTIRTHPPFRYRSGMLSPIYTDNRLLCSYPRERAAICGAFAAVLETHGVRPDLLAGVSTAGIPHAAWLAQRLDLPMVYVRGEAKDHGKGKRVEGTLYPHEPADAARASPTVVVVEDLVTTGGGALDAVAGVRDEGGSVRHCLAICTYGFPQAADAFAAANVTLLPLCSFDDLVHVATLDGSLGASERQLALDWRTDPAGWAARHGLTADA